MPLRRRLVAGLLVVAALGMGVAGTATYVALASFLSEWVDNQLEVIRVPLRTGLTESNALGLQTGPAVEAAAARIAAPPGTYGELRNPDGATRIAASRAVVGGAIGVPELPVALPGSGAAPARAFLSVPAIEADEGPRHYRVLAEPLPGGGTFIAAVPLDEVHDTLDRLLIIQLTVSGLVLVAVALAGWLLVGRNLRPLDEIASTADAIASGDLGLRVRDDWSAPEVRRVGSAMNTMLGTIEQSLETQQASEERLRRFLSDVSHELRTPLTSIRGYAELFRLGADRRDEDLVVAMRRIEEESARMGVLVDDLLLLARLDEGRDVHREPVDLAAIAADAVADARLADAERAITTELDPGIVVSGDEVRLRQVVGNLVTNALVHTPAGTPMAVRVHAVGDEAILEVSDEGDGLDQAAAARVFERFNRGDPARARTTGGTGLGLAIVRALVEAHGGRVELHTAPGAGATFRVVLPLARSAS